MPRLLEETYGTRSLLHIVQHMRRTKNTCPTCKVALESTPKTSRIAANLISSSLLKCPTTLESRSSPAETSASAMDDECAWVGPSKTLDTHLKECLFSTTQCTYAPCDGSMKRKVLCSVHSLCEIERFVVTRSPRSIVLLTPTLACSLQCPSFACSLQGPAESSTRVHASTSGMPMVPD